MRTLPELLESLAAAVSFAHPWDGLEDHLGANGGTLKLVGYGSLVNGTSAAMTLRETGALPRPVIAHGIRRVFNYRMSEPHSRYEVCTDDRNRALLNIDWTRDPGDTISGVLLEVALDDLPALRLRESDYDLVPVACVHWGEPDLPPEPAFALHCHEHSERGQRRVDRSLLPNRDYYEICRVGAATYGEDFLQHWLESTYLGDGVTRVAEWEREWRNPSS